LIRLWIIQDILMRWCVKYTAAEMMMAVLYKYKFGERRGGGSDDFLDKSQSIKLLNIGGRQTAVV